MPITGQLLYQTDMFYKKRVKIRSFYRKISVLKRLLGRGWNKVAGHKAWLQHRCIRFEQYLRTAVSENNDNKKKFLENPPVAMIITW